MSGHWRIGIAACLFVAGLTTLPAFSNPLTDLFNPAPQEAAAPAPVNAPAPAKEACALRPGNATAPGQHWFYRLDGHRKCWFQAAETSHSVNKPAHRYAARRPVVVPEEDEAEPRDKTVMDARAQLLSAAQANASQPTAPAPAVADQPSAPPDEAKPPVPAAPVVAQPATDQLTPARATPRSVDVEEMLLADSSSAKVAAVSSLPPANADAPSTADVDRWESTATRAGVGLIVLGLVFLVGSLLVSRFLDSRLAPIRRA